MITISFKLKDPQNSLTPAKQNASLVYMMAFFELSEKKNNGEKRYIPLKYSTGLKIKPTYWRGKGDGKPEYRAKQISQFDHKTFNIRLDDIENACKTSYRELINEGVSITPELLRERLNKKLDKGPKKPDPDNETFDKYINRFVDEVENGHRISAKGRPFKLFTIKNFKSFKAQFKLFQDHKKKLYDFNDITIDFYDEFIKFFNSKGYSPNTTGRHIRSLKIIMHAARDEGFHNNTEIDRKRFKAISVETHSIYLSESELNSILELNLNDSPLLEIARDVFLIGCYTAQRFSDYSRISKENIRSQQLEQTEKEKKAKKPVRILKTIDIVQEKTGERCIIPIRPELDRILQKYDYTVPKIYEQKLNARIKEIGEKAKINERIRVTEFRGGLKVEKDYFKYELIKTHTARRSGCTNMYLAGIPAIDIMKISGHKTESEFLKYIKVTKEQTAVNLAAHPYFNHLTKVI